MPTDRPVDDHAVLGQRAAFGPGHTLEATATRLVDSIGELRADGCLPPAIRTTVTVLPHQRRLDIRVEGLSPHTDPDRTQIRTVMNVLFELASFHNIVVLDDHTPPLFTQRILLIGTDGLPFAGLIGAAVGDVEPLAGLIFDDPHDTARDPSSDRPPTTGHQ
ncbi:hypothetical protein [Saccharothrix sp. NRRL B-16348]|uniref:hypothetical protein n=1 Tax=Saccharothrix sp. NRRL B-16348 TaxID=1415542 RepID=UPI0007C75E73|nr:hypothetical protein [Saccharothrix sp. NRRL B-16348]